MPEQFVVPQFIDAEDKIFGPITARQFIILMAGGLIEFTFFKLLPFVSFLLVGIPLLILIGVFAFARVNGQAFHYFVLNIIQTFKKPKLRVWAKEYSDTELKVLLKELPVTPQKLKLHKDPFSSSRLTELTLIVNTGGVYKPEEE